MKVELTPIAMKQKIKVKKPKRKPTAPTATRKEMEYYWSLPFEEQQKLFETKGIIISRKYPNFCDGPDSPYVNKAVARTRCYYPEDMEKMKSMTDDERWAYKDHLDTIGRFYYDDNYHVDTPELDEFTKECGINLEDFIIKDK